VFQEKLPAREDGGSEPTRVTEQTQVCTACGAEELRVFAKYCTVCGKRMGEDYEPLDTIRASYNLRAGSVIQAVLVEKQHKNLFEQNKNTLSQMAWACVVYSMVPYLGILFIPFAFVISGFGYAIALRRPHLGGRRLAVVCIVLSFTILSVQMVLWWLLYIIPELAGP
jgi:hypothetical protein